MRQGIIFISILFIILGCGYQNNPNSEDKSATPTLSSSTNTKKILPEKISVGFPDALKDTFTNQNNDEKVETQNSEVNETRGLQQLEKDIYKVEDVVKIAEFNLILLEQVMPEILESCSEIEEHCIFEDGELFFKLDEELIIRIDNVLNEKDRDFLNRVDTAISLGHIDFLKHENEEYELTLNMLTSSFVKDNSLIQEQRQTFKWSTYTNDVTITYNYSNSEDNSTTILRYFVNDEGDEMMYISDKNDTNISLENTTLVVKAIEDENNYSLTSNTTIQDIDENGTTSSHFSTSINVDNNKTHLLLLDKNTTTEVNEREDREGVNMVVDSSKPILVIGPDRSSYIIPSNSVDFSNDKEKDLSLFVFEVESNALASGDYLLLSPEVDVSQLNLSDVLDRSIGSFSVMGGRPQGSLYSEEYIDILNELLIVKVCNEQESTENSEFLVIHNKPKLNIVKK